MKEKYIKPELNVVEFDFDDIITTSPPGPGPCPTICNPDEGFLSSDLEPF